MENVRVQIFILIGLFCKKKVWIFKKRLDKEELNVFTASNGWLESWKKTYGVREKQLCEEADDFSTTTIKAWIKQLVELCQGYQPQNILNLDELRLFFKTLPEKQLTEKKKVKARKNEATNDSYVYCGS